MTVNILAPGAEGVHSVRRVNVNPEQNYVYFRDGDIPSDIVSGTSYIYSDGIGSLDEFPDLVYAAATSSRTLKFLDENENTVAITSFIPGTVTLNFPYLYDNVLNIDLTTSTSQAVKYFTTGSPISGLISGNTYFLRNVSASFTGTESLYGMTNNQHEFTTCGQTGRSGPSVGQIGSAYSSESWANQNIRRGEYDGYQDWTVPVSGVYQFEVKGASGFDGPGAGQTGLGAIVKGKISLVRGETITVAVGQVGDGGTNSPYGGSGGGTFVVRKSGNIPLFVAGGGSAKTNAEGFGRGGKNGELTKRGGRGAANTAGGEDGFGGPATGGVSGGGGGFFGPGADSSYRPNRFSPVSSEPGGGGFSTGLTSVDNNRPGGNGGFGGGGASDGNVFGQSGGGGGFSGGAGARFASGNFSGGGGGSFIAITAIDVATSNGTYDDLTTLSGNPIANLSSYNQGDGSVFVTLVEAFTSGNTLHPTAEDSNNGTNQINLISGGNSYHSLIPISYDIQNNKIHLSSPHGFSNGQAISFNLDQPTSDLSLANIYYVERVDDFSFGLIFSPAINFVSPAGKPSGDSIRRIVVNLDQNVSSVTGNSLNIPSHGFSQDQPVQYSSGDGDPIVPLQNDATYYVSDVIDADNIRLKIAIDSPTSIIFQEAGTGTDHSFIFLTVNFTENTLYIPSHGLVDGQVVKYTTNTGVAVGGLEEQQDYFIKKIDDSTIQLFLNNNLAAGQEVNLSTIGTGTHSLFIRSIDFASNTLTIPQHGFLQGELVEYDARGQTPIAGLSTNQTYYLIFINGDSLKLASTPEDADNGIGINLESSPSGEGRHVLTSLSQTPDGIYSIGSVPSADTFTVQARGQVPELIKIFNPRSSVDPEVSTIFLSAHGFLTGTKLFYEAGDFATAVGGLEDETFYYVVTVNQDYFRLALSLEKAQSGDTINLTNFGSGVAHTLTTNQLNGRIVGSGTVSVVAGSVLVNGVGTSFSKILKVGDPFVLYPPSPTRLFFFGSDNVNTSNNRLEGPHDFEPGDFVKFNTGGGVSPTPLINNYYYYVGVVDENSVQLFTSKAAAIGLTSPVNFGSSGDGENMSLTNTNPSGPIVRRITAVGSDFQITVDRPYSSEFLQAQYAYPTFVYVRPSGYSLHRPFDGGVEMSTGSGNWFGQIIRQTRKYFRYQSGKGIQTSFAINFKPSIDIESMERFSPTQAELKTRRPHNLISGLFIEVSEAEDSLGNSSAIYNGKFQVIVVDLTTFRIVSNQTIPTDTESRAYGFPQFHVNSWSNGAIRSGMFDFQNGMFFEFDGQNLYCVRRSSTQQTAGTVSALRGSELIFGDNTKFTAQFKNGDYMVLRGQTYRIIDIQDDETLSVRPEYRGSTGLEITFNPEQQSNITENSFSIVRHGLSANLPLVYNSVDGEPMGGLINGRTYYADVLDANSFRLLISPNGATVNISSVGTTDFHSFVPAKSGIIVTKTVDTKVPQSEWNIDKCDGTGPSGYDLDLSRIQMCYMDYSWYGAGKIRYGFKTNDGLVRYVHEFKHNNILFESYFRSGNLPARYEVITFENPTYVPSLFHWGTSVIMDGTFDDDRGYLFTAGSQNLSVSGTTTKSFAGTGIDLETDLITSLTHGFRTGDQVQFQSIASDGLPGDDTQNPEVAIVGSNELEYLSNTNTYGVLTSSSDEIYLTPKNSLIKTFDTVDGGIRTSQSGIVVTVVSPGHGLSSGDYVAILGSTRVQNGAFFINVVDEDTFTYQLHEFEEFTTPGTYTWTAPDGVKNVSAMAVGGGGGGGQTSDGTGGGAGGGLGWKRRISVSPGEEYAVVVGSGGTRDTVTGTGNNASSGGDSYFISSNIVAGLGGGPAGQVGTGTVYRRGGAGGGFVGDGGGFGGNGGQHNRNDRGGGGGGAGGYEGNGGIGGGDGAGLAGNGGAAGGGGAGSSTLTGGNGGGVGILGIGTSGSGGALGGNGIGGGGGSGGETGRNGTVVPRVAGLYGGGGGGHDNTGQVNADGAGGAIRIIWGGNSQYPNIGTNEVSLDNDTNVIYGEAVKFITSGNIQYTYFLHPEGSLNNTTGPNYQPLVSLRLSPSADSGLTGKLGDRDIINRMQVRMQEIGVSTDELVEVKLILNGRLNNLGFTAVAPPSLVELVEHTLQDTISGGIQIYNFQAEANSTTNLELDTLFELSNSILGGDNIFPDGPDILTVAVSRLTGNNTRTSAKLSWLEAQA